MTSQSRLGDAALQSETLDSLASLRNYHGWLTELALPSLGDNPLELGSGLGDYARTWLNAGVPRLTLTELDPERLTHLRRRFENELRVRVAAVDSLEPTIDRSTLEPGCFQRP